MLSQLEPVRFPASLGSSTIHTVAPQVAVRIFLVDESVPLYNVVYGPLKFFADRAQAERQIEALSLDGAKMPAPDWTWKLDAGFDRSVDGHSKKGWTVQYDRQEIPAK
ncbi:hypothetical protein [Paraburkholderia phosphatilytica]|uniref:hypothetical protein n=1 Tax=Paraburkholderia phosphatilytica TaxID=2282883 RepID=UPI000E526A23|nr:hypothetical protein [Paraburkholderia phosphatilytica]